MKNFNLKAIAKNIIRLLIKFLILIIILITLFIVSANLVYKVPYLKDKARNLRDRYRVVMVERTFEPNDVRQQNVQNIIDAGSEVNNDYPYPNQVAFLYTFNNRLKIYVQPGSYCALSSYKFVDIDNDGKYDEVAVDCGSGGQMGDLYLYKINQKDGSIDFLNSFYSYGIPDLEDVNGDKFLDVSTFDREYPDDPSALGYKWVRSSYYWNNSPEVKNFEKNPVKSYAD